MLPPVKYINPGPMPQQADAGAAMAAGRAITEVGNALAGVGERGMEIMGRARRIEEAGKINAFMASMDEEAAQFSQALATRSDTDAWPTEWREKAADMKQRAAALGLSPEGAAALDNQFTDWSTQRSIGFQAESLTKSLGMARMQTATALNYYAARGDQTGFETALGTAVQSGHFNPAEAEQAKMEFARSAAARDLDTAITSNPMGTLEKLESGQWIKDHPGATLDQVEAAKSAAATQMQKAVHNSLNEYADMAASGKIRSAEDIDKIYGNAVPPRVLEQMHQNFKRRNDDAEKEMQQDPQFWASVVGKVNEKLKTYVPNTQGFDTDLALMQMEVDRLPENGVKSTLQKQIRDKVDGIQAEAKTYFDAALDQIDEAHKQGRFGKSGEVSKLQVRDLVKRGFLKDKDKLVRLGYSEDQAAAIVDLAKKDPALAQRKFIDLRKDRPGGGVNASEIEIATADALWNGNPTISWNDPSSEVRVENEKASAQQKYGAARIRFLEFKRLNPNASKAEIDKEFIKITGAEIKRQTQQKILPAVPSRETSMNGKGVNPNVSKLYGVVSTKFPSVENWGIWGDEKHQARKSDHNSGDAIDIAVKGNKGSEVVKEIEANAVAHNVKYMIHNGRIWKPTTGWKPYDGSDNHSEHVHVSFLR